MTPDEVSQLPFGKVFAARTDMVLDEIFVWFELERAPTPAELRALRRRVAAVPRGPHIYINVDAENEQNMRFAKFCGFVEVRRVGTTSVQVLESK